MTGTRYPRDLRGYGRNPPHPQWPGNARVAVQFVVNFEEGSENNILHGDPASEAFLSDVLGAQPWPGQRHANIESMFEYGSRAGFWRLWRIFSERKWPTTVFGVATALKRNPEIVAAMKEAGWDIASHSLKWIEHKDMTEAQERAENRGSDPRPHRSDRLAAAWLVYRTLLDQHQPSVDGGGRLPLSQRFLCR
ncbi:peptidoglycan/xylan/chitin deacetylase (PgdA/CDA1 family) [Bradyrhizobium sp. F1.13.4]